jgi:diguanylate cyclase
LKTEIHLSDKFALKPYTDFRSAAEAILEYLHQSLGFSLWMVTRTEGDNWIVLRALDAGYGVQDGDVFRWTDSFCSRMVCGDGPQIAPRSKAVPAYATAPIGAQVPIEAYVGVPLESEDGTLFGTLCAIDPKPQPDTIVTALPTVRLLSRLLGTILASELKVDREQRRAERALEDALRDPLTGLANRRAWDRLMASEEERCRRYGHPACVFSIDLDNFKRINDSQGHAAGDAILQRAARILETVCRSTDVIARLGGDEFGILAVESDVITGNALLTRLEESLSGAGVAASIGMATKNPASDLTDAIKRADTLMYQRKAKTKAEEIYGVETGLLA